MYIHTGKSQQLYEVIVIISDHLICTESVTG